MTLCSGLTEVARALVSPSPAGRDPVMRQGLDSFLLRLHAEREIRLFVEAAPNLGHQASSVRVLERLTRDFGYRGRITVVYGVGRTPECGDTVEKLRLLVPNFADLAPIRMGDAEVHFLDTDSFGRPDRLLLGFTGGADAYNVVNLADSLRTRFLLRLQPYFWTWAMDEICRDDDPQHLILASESCFGGPFMHRSYWIPDPCERSSPAGNSHELRRVFAEVEQTGALFCPIYGVRDRGCGGLNAYQVLPPFLAGIARALDGSLRYGGADSPVCARSPDRALRLPGPPHAVIVNFDRLTPETIASLEAPPQISFVQLGPVPPALFAQAIFRATLPPLFEGHTTAALAIRSGKPYLHVAHQHDDDSAPRYPTLPFPDLERPPQAEAAQAVANLLGGGRAEAVSAVADFIDRAYLSPDPGLIDYFAKLGRFYRDPYNDKLTISLSLLGHLLSDA